MDIIIYKNAYLTVYLIIIIIVLILMQMDFIVFQCNCAPTLYGTLLVIGEVA